MSNSDAGAAFGAPSPTHRPSRAGIWLGAVLLVVAVLGAIAWFVLGLVSFAHALDDLERVPVNGGRVVRLDDGRNSIYYEGPGGEDAGVPPLAVRIVPLDGGAPLQVGGHSGEVTYSMSGHAGRSFAGFRAPRDGRYRVTVEAPPGAPVAEIAIGPGLGSRLLRAILGAIAIFIVCGGVGTALIAVTATRRSR